MSVFSPLTRAHLLSDGCALCCELLELETWESLPGFKPMSELGDEKRKRRKREGEDLDATEKIAWDRASPPERLHMVSHAPGPL